MNENMTATLIQDNLPGYKGHAALFKLSPPMEGHADWDDNGNKTIPTHEFVVLSATIAFDHGSAETFIFPADKKGKVTNWGELPGSMRGTLDHDYILWRKGYQVVK